MTDRSPTLSIVGAWARGALTATLLGALATLLAMGVGAAAQGESPLEGRWILGDEACARAPESSGCADLQIVRVAVRGDRLEARLDRPSGGLRRIGVRQGRPMFTATVGGDGGIGHGTLHSIYPPRRECSADPFISADNPVVSGRVVEGAPPRLVLEYDYLPYDHARCALHTDRPDRRRNVYHRVGP